MPADLSLLKLSKGDRVHLVGIGGIGVSAIARHLAKHRGARISGSDVALPPAERLPEGTYTGDHRAENVPDDTMLLIYSPAVPENNPERQRARERNIPQLSYPEALAWITKDATTIAVSGTHGKSTTTALLGLLCDAGGLDPTVIVGAEVPAWGGLNFHAGKGELFIVEACEYRRHMLNLSPHAILLTNLELDHPDYYRDLADVKDAFRTYVEKLSGEGLLVINNDDANLRDLRNGLDAIIVTYGVGEGADLVAKNIESSAVGQTFTLEWKGSLLGEFSTPLSGIYNIYNILAATALYLSYGGNNDAIAKVLSTFHGVGRRFEEVGTLSNAIIISDYAHHPTALNAVVNAAKERYRGKRILVVFRPHHRERTVKLFDDFVRAGKNIPHLILTEIYDVTGREDGAAISSRELIAKITENNGSRDVTYAADLNEAERLVRERADQFDVVLIVGAGDADQLARRLVS